MKFLPSMLIVNVCPKMSENIDESQNQHKKSNDNSDINNDKGDTSPLSCMHCLYINNLIKIKYCLPNQTVVYAQQVL